MNLFDLSGKTACITGAARGIGEAVARGLHNAGCRTVLVDVDHSVRKTAQSLDSSGDTASAAILDIADVNASIEYFRSVDEVEGGIDILVNNAARTPMKSIWDIEPDEWDHILAINLRGVFFSCQVIGMKMMNRQWGRIINLASLAGQQPSAVTGAHYAASKAAIISVTKNFAQALAGYGVTVNAISPAAVRTPVMDELGEQKIRAIASNIPVGRVGRADEVAAVAVFLASEAASYMTGTTIDVNGGRHMR